MFSPRKGIADARCAALILLSTKGGFMPERETIERAREDAREGQSPSTQAGEFVREEVHHIREGISYNAGVVKYFFSTLLHPLRDERHFALVETSAIPTKARS
jgi:hypothetical protein